MPYSQTFFWHATDQDLFESEGFVLTEQFRGKRGPGAASFLLASPFLPFVVLEGAPGQGKSTITQYVCQVHRMRLLDKVDQLAQIPEPQRTLGVRLPFKIDLRDLASWLSRRNPFSAEGEEVSLNSSERTLEGFLAALVRHHSGGAAFDVSDLHGVFRVSAVLVVLDG